MTLRSIIRASLAVLVAIHVGSAFAQILLDESLDTSTQGNDHVWDCWISADLKTKVVTYMIRCIPDRDVLPADPPADSPQAVILDMIHDHIHRNEAAEIDLDLASGRLAEVSRYIKQVRIYQYPYEESWLQSRPQQLVESVLCKNQTNCAVLLYR